MKEVRPESLETPRFKMLIKELVPILHNGYVLCSYVVQFPIYNLMMETICSAYFFPFCCEHIELLCLCEYLFINKCKGAADVTYS